MMRAASNTGMSSVQLYMRSIAYSFAATTQPAAKNAAVGISRAVSVHAGAASEACDARGANLARLDWAVQQCRKHNLYIIFDLHVWRGQEAGRVSAGGSDGEAARARAYDLITFGAGCERERRAQRDAAIATWQRVIEHFRGALPSHCLLQTCTH